MRRRWRLDEKKKKCLLPDSERISLSIEARSGRRCVVSADHEWLHHYKRVLGGEL